MFRPWHWTWQFSSSVKPGSLVKTSTAIGNFSIDVSKPNLYSPLKFCTFSFSILKYFFYVYSVFTLSSLTCLSYYQNTWLCPTITLSAVFFNFSLYHMINKTSSKEKAYVLWIGFLELMISQLMFRGQEVATAVIHFFGSSSEQM